MEKIVHFYPGHFPPMEPSHGCIHMQPRDRDALIGLGVLRAGTTLIIHPYGQRYGAGP